MKAGGSGDRPEAIVDGMFDIVALAPASNLFRVRDTAGEAKVDARVLDPVFLDQLSELPLAGDLLACRQWDRGAGLERLEGMPVFRAKG
jgi:hypothetical protein